MAVNSDEYYMNFAVREAEMARDEQEVPIGAVVVDPKGNVIARAHNYTEHLTDPTAHAEMQAITSATEHLGAKYLQDCQIFVTVEPCPMCAAALRWAQISRIVWGADDQKQGYRRFSPELIHPKTTIKNGVHKEKCETLMQQFFIDKR